MYFIKPLRILYMGIVYFDHNTPLSLTSPRSVPTPLDFMSLFLWFSLEIIAYWVWFAFILKNVFSYIVFWSPFPSPTFPFSQLHILSLSLKSKHNPPNKNTKIETKIYKQKTNKMSKQNIMKPKVYKNTTEFDFSWSVVLGMGPILKFWLAYPVRRHWRKQRFPFADGLIHRQFLVGDGCLCPLPHLSAGTPDFNPYRLWACCHNSLWVHTYVSLTVPGEHGFLRIIPSSTYISPPLPSSSPSFFFPPVRLAESWEKGFDEDILFRTECSEVRSLFTVCTLLSSGSLC